jgi:hypothetical protein
MKTYIVKWQGPFDDFEIEKLNAAFGLYLITGYQKAKRTKDIQYCGITEKDLSKRLAKHHKKDLVTREREYWFGQIVSTSELQRVDLELVESLIVYFWQPQLNEKKKKNPPEPTVVISRWYDKNKKLRRRNTHEGQNLDDVIFWDGEEWHIGDLKIY